MKKILFLFILAYSSTMYSQVNFTSSNLPIVIIDTKGKTIVDEPKVLVKMGIIDNGPGNINHVTDSLNGYDGWIGIEIRGSSSQMFPKKQYGFETADSLGEDLDVSLLGFPEESDWILSAPYTDKTMFRNVLVYQLATDMGRYASRNKFCELVINGEYRGAYILMEKIKRDKNRVNIKKLEPKDSTGDKLTGGYIIKLDKLTGSDTEGWFSRFRPLDDVSRKVYFQYDTPKQKDLVPQQETYIQKYIYDIENNLNTALYNDPVRGYYHNINLDSFVDLFIANEITKNVDGYRLSTFLYKDRDSEDGRLTFGPVWDYDLGFGNVNYDDSYTTEGWKLLTKNYSEWLTPFWFKKLFLDPVFQNRLAKKWNDLKGTSLSYNYFDDKIDSLVILTNQARIRNFEKWKIIGEYVWPNNYIGKTYEDDVNYLKVWIYNRINWINSQILSSYTFIDWNDYKTKAFVYDDLVKGNSAKLPLSIFYNSIQNSDSLKFISDSPEMSFNVLSDSVEINISKPGKYKFAGAGYHLNTKTSVSPLYYMESTIVGIEDEEQIPTKFALEQNYPNPFNPTTTINYSLPKESFINLTVYNILGKEMINLVDETKEAGQYKVMFDASGLSSGIYFYTLNTGEITITKKMILVK
ncbi:MAG: CotH kinase family protein [Melioribacteraceae bacterium]|nr:CotH kinase family protein [Melioribacteraceae bacterium]